MQKTIILTFDVSPKVEERQKWSVLEEAQSCLNRRTLICERFGDRLVARHVHKEWDNPIGSGSFPENSFWNISVEGMRFLNFTIEYTDSLLPSPKADFAGNFEFRNGECYFFIEIRDRVVVTCLPSQKKVSVSLDMLGCHNDQNILRIGILDIQHAIEAQLKLTQTAQRLIQAYEVDSENAGRVQRFKNKLFLEIARV